MARATPPVLQVENLSHRYWASPPRARSQPARLAGTGRGKLGARREAGPEGRSVNHRPAVGTLTHFLRPPHGFSCQPHSPKHCPVAVVRQRFPLCAEGNLSLQRKAGERKGRARGVQGPPTRLVQPCDSDRGRGTASGARLQMQGSALPAPRSGSQGTPEQPAQPAAQGVSRERDAGHTGLLPLDHLGLRTASTQGLAVLR